MAWSHSSPWGVMKLVVMSDTHLSRVTPEFEAICERYCRDADLVIHLGDAARSCVLDFLERYPLAAVAGNMDDAVIRNRLPLRRVLTAEGYRIGITHGWGGALDLKGKLCNEFPHVDAILFGHTHQAVLVQEEGLLWFNPGSVFAGRGGAPCSLGVLHVQDGLRGEIIRL